MNNQLTLFENMPVLPPEERRFQPSTEHNCKVFLFPGVDQSILTDVDPVSNTTSNNSVRGKSKTVYPIQSMEQISAMARYLLDHEDPKYVLLFTIGINLGLRAGELRKMTVRDVFNPDGSIRYTEDVSDIGDLVLINQSKNHKRRRLFLNRACVDALEWYFKNKRIYDFDKYLFPSPYGGAIEVDTIRKVLKDAAAAAGVTINVGTHTMRKTWAVWAAKNNPGLEDEKITLIQLMLGHTSPVTTMAYMGYMDRDFKAVYHRSVLMPLDFRSL